MRLYVSIVLCLPDDSSLGMCSSFFRSRAQSYKGADQHTMSSYGTIFEVCNSCTVPVPILRYHQTFMTAVHLSGTWQAVALEHACNNSWKANGRDASFTDWPKCIHQCG